MSLTAYVVATAGAGLFIAGNVTAGYLISRSMNWSHDEAN
jgi:hypothetical protein